jgi:hypothetical protein
VDDLPNPYRPPVKPGTKAAVPTPSIQQASVVPEQQPAKGGKKTKSLFNQIRSWVGDQIVNKDAVKALKKSYPQLLITREELQANKVPCICFIGTSDGLYYLGESLHENMANLEYVRITGASHFTTPFYGEFKSKLRDFFERHRGNG